MKKTIFLLALARLAFAQGPPAVQPVIPQSVTITIVVTPESGSTIIYSTSLTSPAITALAQLIAQTTVVTPTIVDGITTYNYSPKYQDEGDLLIQNAVQALVLPALLMFPSKDVASALDAAQKAQVAVTTTAVQAASGEVTKQ